MKYMFKIKTDICGQVSTKPKLNNGGITDSKIINDRETGRSRGFGFKRIRKKTWPPGRFWWGGKTRGNDAPTRRRCSGFSDDAPDLRSVVEDTERGGHRKLWLLYQNNTVVKYLRYADSHEWVKVMIVRITLLLGPPGCEKTSLLKALSGNLDKSLKECIPKPCQAICSE
ncbi:hypothetical protein POM88_051946 [Heracleum sosnowskyi]|uniref:Uncharacterized protein n=1 Tax=Heracleum sosnowskyi TaxID=360622 RepID=A0AAD8LY73_9APIA|nr:hypothetical protein POM88_051946 [Heracleum sosnowskyi]